MCFDSLCKCQAAADSCSWRATGSRVGNWISFCTSENQRNRSVNDGLNKERKRILMRIMQLNRCSNDLFETGYLFVKEEERNK